MPGSNLELCHRSHTASQEWCNWQTLLPKRVTIQRLTCTKPMTLLWGIISLRMLISLRTHFTALGLRVSTIYMFRKWWLPSMRHVALFRGGLRTQRIRNHLGQEKKGTYKFGKIWRSLRYLLLSRGLGIQCFHWTTVLGGLFWVWILPIVFQAVKSWAFLSHQWASGYLIFFVQGQREEFIQFQPC